MIPEHWGTLSKEGEEFFNQLAHKAIKDLKNLDIKIVLNNFLVENHKFSMTNNDADASCKEVQLTVQEFLTNLSSTSEFTEEDILYFWQITFWEGKEIL